MTIKQHILSQYRRKRHIMDIPYLVIHRFGWTELDEWDRHGVTPCPAGVKKFYETNPEARRATDGQQPYTFQIGQFGATYQTALLDDVTPHAARFNAEAVGVACYGDFGMLPMPQEQRQALVELCVLVLPLLGWPLIRSHDELRAGEDLKAKGCPGRQLNMDALRHDVAAMLDRRARNDAVQIGMRL